MIACRCQSVGRGHGGVACRRNILLLRRCPARQEPESVRGGGAWFRHVDQKLPSWVRREVGALEQEVEIADDRVVEVLHPGGVTADVVGAPLRPELFAPGGELTDEVLEVLVVWVAAGLAAKDRDDLIGGEFPVGIEEL
jgi:hypothetical protein